MNVGEWLIVHLDVWTSIKQDSTQQLTRTLNTLCFVTVCQSLICICFVSLCLCFTSLFLLCTTILQISCTLSLISIIHYEDPTLSFFADENISEESSHIEAATQQTLHYTLANQQVQFHRIGEDGQVQVVSALTFYCQSSFYIYTKRTSYSLVRQSVLFKNDNNFNY